MGLKFAGVSSTLEKFHHGQHANPAKRQTESAAYIPDHRSMNSRTFARLMLLLPLFIFIGSMGYLIAYDMAPNQISVLQTINSSWNSLLIYWIVPYGLLVIYLLVWSRKKTMEEIQETFGLAPIMLMLLAGAAYLLIALYIAAVGENTLQGREVGAFVVVGLVSIPAGLIGGYVIVGVSILIYKLFQKLRLIRD